MKLLSPLLPTTALALGLAACGGGGDKKTETTRGYSAVRGYDQTIAAVNDICNRANAATNPVSAKLNGKARHDAPILAKLTATNQRFVDELGTIKPDPKLADAFGRFKASIEDINAKAKDIAASATKSTDESYRASVEALDGLDKENDKIALELGAKDCAKD